MEDHLRNENRLNKEWEVKRAILNTKITFLLELLLIICVHLPVGPFFAPAPITPALIYVHLIENF